MQLESRGSQARAVRAWLPRAGGLVEQGPGRLPRRKLSRRQREALAAYVFLLPWLVGMVGITLGPMLASLWISFTRYNLLSPPHWIGLGNYDALLHDPLFASAVKVTLLYVGVSVPIQIGFALFLAVLLNRGMKALGLVRAVYYIPSLLGSSVAIAIVWRTLFGYDGTVDRVVELFGWHNPPAWIDDPHTAVYTLVVLAAWQFGAPMIIFLAGLRNIPKELYEAADVDGAHRWLQFRRITLPLLSPLILFNLVLQVIGSFQAFTPAYVISGGTGGPASSTLFYTLYLYQEAFGQLDMGYGSAMAWVLLVAIVAVTAAIFATSRRWVFYMDRQA